MNRIAFIGLGTMGYPMAGHLAKAGHSLTVFNRTGEKAAAWCREFGGEQAASPREAATGARLIFTCVGNDDDLRAVVLGPEGVLAGISPGAVLVDHSTVSASLARELAEHLNDAGAGFIDAPVSGGQQGAINGQLTIMCGGQADIYAQVRPVVAAYARAINRMGDAGAGQQTKMVNQICVAGLVEALAEGMHFAERAGLDLPQVMEAISQGAASSWQMINRHKTMIAGEYRHGFAVDWMRKDLAICMEEAARLGVDLPATRLVDSFYADVQTMGGGRWDTSSLLARLQKNAAEH